DLQVINCPTVSQNFRAKPRRVVVSLDRATPTVGQFIFWIFLKELVKNKGIKSILVFPIAGKPKETASKLNELVLKQSTGKKG
ncbi:MAG: hypothetical protein MJK14_01735, partial [Rivularia sp. ALOHA_DT_140]|nr:hypothetical protein [Rivularia sp. ALOHA_DT_140]